MRALAAVVVTLAAWSRIHALETAKAPARALDPLPRALLSSLGIGDGSPAQKLLTCSQSLGPSKCFSALSVWRAEHAIEALETGRAAQFDLREDVEKFPWEQYGNSSDEQLYTQLADDTEKLLRYRTLKITVPGYSLELESKGNGKLNVDVLKNDEPSDEQRGMKKLQKQFYNIMPLLLLPGLVMSAILPFILPMLKMTTVAVGMLNNMALSGAVFTLLRNNAFNDHYEKKVIYVNEGYKNEKYSPIYLKDLDHLEFAGSDVQPVVQQFGQPLRGELTGELSGGQLSGGQLSGGQLTGVALSGGSLNSIQDELNADWINQYYGNVGTVSSANVFANAPSDQNKPQTRRSSRIKVNPYQT